MKARLVISTLLCAFALPVQAHGDWTSARPDGHAPMGVMADHAHSAGEWMLSYQHSRMSMSGLRDGSDRISADTALEDYDSVPTDMDMDMHMLMLMYAPTDRLTLMLMGHYMDNSMTAYMDDPMPMTHKMETSGLADIYIGGIYKALDANRQQVLINMGMTVPTGSTDETMTMMGDTVHAGFAMQPGSGTWDLMPGITWLGQGEDWSWGAQAMATLRTGSNDEGYSLGDELRFTTWGARRLNNWLSLSLRLEQHQFGNVDGEDSAMYPDPNDGPASPAADPRNQGGERTSIGLGLNLRLLGERFAGHRFGLEVIEPVRERLDGPQMALDRTITAAWEYAW